MPITFKSLTEQLTSQRPDGKSLVDLSLRTDSLFCQALVSNGYLSEAQMQHAAQRYRLGRSKDGAVVFWEIDEDLRIRDGKLMWYHDDCHRIKDKNPTWVTACLKKQGELPNFFEPQRCLFGQHLLTAGSSSGDTAPKAIAIVEAEKTAIICSELFPQYLWMAPGGLTMLSAARLYPLRDHKVVVFPDTDPDGKTFADWKDKIAAAQEHFKYPIRLSPILEDNATPAQKQQKIDLVEFLFQ